ncbi:MAG: 2,3-bisphosphoglycerate-dependent phosphoglycerate mutase [Candidatus Woesearchaeota archaeon]|nr:MAG: 2,3-bisphosphoglycerate-dependent phosphoglycerate mutase [Candidatus Woesearchaeota archaeon]
MTYLILLRHGESRWNMVNKFTGWVDVPLSEVGVHEALIAAAHLEGLKIDVAFTSKLTRAQETLLLVLARQAYTGMFMHDTVKEKRWAKHHGKRESNEIPIYSDLALNERYYGDLQGRNKETARKTYGEKQVFLWRRSFAIRPPGGESLQDVCKRTIPYFEKTILPIVQSKKNVIISAHGNSLRAIIKHLDSISDKDIPLLELPTGKPLIYKYVRGKLVKEKQEHSFTRPLDWTVTKKPDVKKLKKRHA